MLEKGTRRVTAGRGHSLHPLTFNYGEKCFRGWLSARDGTGSSLSKAHIHVRERQLCVAGFEEGWLQNPASHGERQGGKGVLWISRPRGRSPATLGLKGQRGGQESDRRSICSFRPWLNRCSHTGRATSQERGFSGNINFLL